MFIVGLRQENTANDQIPEITDFGQLAQFFTEKNDKVFAYTFANSEYVLAERLPAISDFYYLPMQFDLYAKNQDTNNKVCHQLQKSLPKIGYFVKYDFSESNPWDNYGKCINDFIKKSYYNLTFPNLLVRKDLLISSPEMENKVGVSKMIPSQKIKKNSEYNIVMKSLIEKNAQKIDKIGILFATYQHKFNGNLKLVTQNLEGEVRTVAIKAKEVVDNRYTFVNLKPDYYVKFGIYLEDDSELSVWEISSLDQTESCLVTKFVNDKFYLTHGCAPF